MADDPEDAPAGGLARLLKHQAENRPQILELTKRLGLMYFTSGRDRRFAEAFEDALTGLAARHAGGVGEARAVVVYGDTGSGKSRLVRQGIRNHPVFPGFGDPESGCAALFVRVPGACTLRVLGLEILRASGYPIEDGRENVVWVKVRDRLERLGVLVIHIDEVNNLIGTANPIEQAKIGNNLKAMLNHGQWPVVLVISGTPESEPIIKRDRQLRRRADVVRLLPLAPGPDNRKVAQPIAELCRAADVAVSEEAIARIVPRLMQAAAFQYGICIEISVKAVIGAAQDRKPLGIGHFADAYAGRTSAAGDANPFLSAAWRAIVSEWAVVEEAAGDGDDGTGAGSPRRPRAPEGGR